MSGASTPGKLYLIGAGPGDPELLTLKAARVLRECDVVLYDRLVSAEVLSFANPASELIYVGKQAGEQEGTQARIFELIREHALAGKRVARLKGGDPLVFGRGAEEWKVALEHGIEVELVPGISSGISVPALAGIPLTYRGVSQSFVVVAGHCLPSKKGVSHNVVKRHWRKYAKVDTLVVLMGVKNRVIIAKALIAAGRKADEPIAFIERGSMPDAVVIESTLGEVASGKIAANSPAVFVIGEAVRLRRALTAPAGSPAQPIPTAAK